MQSLSCKIQGKHLFKHGIEIAAIIILCLPVQVVFSNETVDMSRIGIPKNDRELFSVFKENPKLTAAQQHELISKMYLNASPIIDLESLHKIWKSKRQSISSFSIDYQEAYCHLDGKGKKENLRKLNYKYIYGGKNKLQYVRMGKIEPGASEKVLVSLYEDRKITVSFPKNNYVNAGILGVTPQEHMVSFWNPYNPVLCSSLLSDKDFYQPVVQNRDVVAALSDSTRYHVMEGIENINGYRCVVVANISSRFCLSIDHNYAIIQHTTYKPITLSSDRSTNPNERKFIDRSQIYQCTCSELVDVGNGIWFPKKIEIESEDETQLHQLIIMHVNDIRINEQIPDSIFTEVIPDGAYVADGIRDMVYIWGNRTSIGSLIKETVKSKRQTIYRNFSIVLGLCFIACWGIVEWRKRRLQKGEVE